MKGLRRLVPIVPAFLATLAGAQPGPPDWEQGLLVREFPRHAEQDGEKAFVDPARFGEPVGEPYLVPSLDGWTYDTDRNAIAGGVLVAPESGRYRFRSESYYDRNLLRVAGEIVCDYRDGESRVQSIRLEKGRVPIESIGFVDGRGGTRGITVSWQPPGQRELGPIPAEALRHRRRPGVTFRERERRGEDVPDSLRARHLTVVAKDFVIEAYHNGRRLPQGARRMKLDRFGSTVERIDVEVHAGDWLVFHVAHNRLRHGGARFFAVTGHLDEDRVGFVSRADSADWSACDSPDRAHDFIHFRESGTESRAIEIAKPWKEGRKFMKRHSGHEFAGDPIWGTAPSTWIKYTVPAEAHVPIRNEIRAGESVRRPASEAPDAPAVEATEAEGGWGAPPEPRGEGAEIGPGKIGALGGIRRRLPVVEPRRWTVQILSAVYGAGGKDADVTDRVQELVEEKRKRFSVNPRDLGADPNPGWNKSLRIVYLKDGVRREQRHGENARVLPDSFYGPQDGAELSEWLEGTRWRGPRGEVQFHRNALLAGPEWEGEADWECPAANRVRIHWPAADAPVEYRFDPEWTSFRRPGDGKDEYRIVR